MARTAIRCQTHRGRADDVHRRRRELPSRVCGRAGGARCWQLLDRLDHLLPDVVRTVLDLPPDWGTVGRYRDRLRREAT